MPRRAARSNQRRMQALLIVCGMAMVADAATALAKTAPIDQTRAQAALALAAHYWTRAGLDKLPARYDRARFEKAVGGEDDPYNIVAAIAVATLNANPGRKDAVFK